MPGNANPAAGLSAFASPLVRVERLIVSIRARSNLSPSRYFCRSTTLPNKKKNQARIALE